MAERGSLSPSLRESSS